MVDLARQAFSTNNFGLAADIYERAIKENGPQTDLYLGLADSFARCGQFNKAFQAYTNAFRLSKSLTHEKLKHLVTALIEIVNHEPTIALSQGLTKKCYMFTCVLCRGLLNDPVTIPCGHTFCRKCLDKDRLQTCKVCGIVHYRLKPSSITTNVVLSKLIQKWFGDEFKAVLLKDEGNKFIEKQDFANAITVYSKAIALCKTDHLLFSNRSYAYASLDRFDEALDDAENVVRLRPDWPKGYFRKGAALYGLGLYEDAVIAFMQCLALDKDVSSAKEFLSKSLYIILSRLPPDDPKTHEREREWNPTLFQTLVSNNFHMATCLPHFTANTISELRQIMQNTVVEASKCDNSGPSAHNDSGTLALDSSGHHSSTGISAVDDSASMFRDEAIAGTSGQSMPTLDILTVTQHLKSEECTRSWSPDTKMDETPCRKRSREPSTTQPSPTHMPQKCLKSESQPESNTSDFKEIDSSLLNVDDLECSLCFRLFYQPVTTPCGHTFCRACLDRCLDHQSTCPLCKGSLAEYLAERRQAVTDSLQAIITTYFLKEYLERQKANEEELTELARMGDNHHEIPVFVCTMSFPTVPCPLHIFEPRYRLMIRRCMESGARQFGMCLPVGDNEECFSDFGCMLEIRDVHFFPDGRSLVNTVGGKRFKVLSRERRDGYNTAKVEFLEDRHITPEELHEVQYLEEAVHRQAKIWLDSLPNTHHTRISRHFGDLPSIDPRPAICPNGPAWAWWIVAVLPLDNRIQLAMVAMTSYRERLQAIKRIIQHLTSSRGQ